MDPAAAEDGPVIVNEIVARDLDRRRLIMAKESLLDYDIVVDDCRADVARAVDALQIAGGAHRRPGRSAVLSGLGGCLRGTTGGRSAGTTARLKNETAQQNEPGRAGMRDTGSGARGVS
jgi:hypothetical protein